MKTNDTFLMIDPPSGWMYGFPKEISSQEYQETKSLKQWCIDNGYPKEIADTYGEYFHVRIIGDIPEKKRF